MNALSDDYASFHIVVENSGETEESHKLIYEGRRLAPLKGSIESKRTFAEVLNC